MMFMLRKIPKRTDSVKFSGYKFEVVDIDNYRIDQLLVTRIDNKPTVLVPKLPDAEEKVSARFPVPITSTAPIGAVF
jgi:Mg2+/Co2+ transporter CorC